MMITQKISIFEPSLRTNLKSGISRYRCYLGRASIYIFLINCERQRARKKRPDRFDHNKRLIKLIERPVKIREGSASYSNEKDGCLRIFNLLTMDRFHAKSFHVNF